MRLENEFIGKLEKYIEEGYVSKRKHPVHPIYILNYTASTQFDWKWDEVTMLCRGLVIDEDYNIVARSLPKFFSYEQLDGKLPDGEFVVEEKLDGSMLLVFKYNGELITATRGSFESDQATDAKRFLHPMLSDILEHSPATLVFEYISKANRIVVDYDFEGLVYLCAVLESGYERTSYYYNYISSIGYKWVKTYNFKSVEEILAYEEPNFEGFVLRYESGERVKVKLEEYKRLHRLLTGFNEKDVWEALKEDKLASVLEEVPDEMYVWIKRVEAQLRAEFNKIRLDAMVNMKDFGNRKDNALYYQTCKYPAVMFYLLDGKDINPLIWRMVKPKVTQTFRVVGEDSN